MKLVWDESGIGMKVVLDEIYTFGMKVVLDELVFYRSFRLVLLLKVDVLFPYTRLNQNRRVPLQSSI